MLIKILAPAFYAYQDTKTPVKYGVIAMSTNMIFNIVLAIPFGYVGLALATSLSAVVNVGLSYRRLHQLNYFRLSKTAIRVKSCVGNCRDGVCLP